MLQSLREKTSGWIASTILGLLVIPFAFFGIEQYSRGGGDTYVARVQAPPQWWPGAPSFAPFNRLWMREDITQQEFRARLDQLRLQQRQQQGDAFDSQAFESADNKRRILEQMIDERIMRMAGERNGVYVSDMAVRKQIESIPDFQINGRFDPAQYQRVLATQQPPMSAVQFEAGIRETLRQNALAGRIAATDFVTPGEIDRLAATLNEQREVTSTLVNIVPDTSTVDAASINAWYLSHKQAYLLPVTATFEVVDADPASLPGVSVSEAELRAAYEADKAKYQGGGQRLASHILIAVAKDARPEVVAAARAKAEQLAAQAGAAGADFAALAKANSDDAGSKANGGDLGWVAQDGTMVKPFEDALFALHKGQISKPVRSDFGFHVIQVRDEKAGKLVSFEQARPELEKTLSKAATDKAASVAMGALADEAYRNPSSFAATAALQKLPVTRVGPVSAATATGVLAQPAVRRVAFSDSLLQQRGVSDPITIAPGHVVMVHVLDSTPARQRSLDEVREQVISDVRAERASKAAAARADALVKAVNAGQTLAQAAAPMGLKVTAPVFMPRGQAPTPEVNQAIFSTLKPAAGRQSAGKAALPGGWLVFAVTAVKASAQQALPADVRKGLMDQVARANGQATATGYVKAIRKQYTIKIEESRL